jgi:hypothetical protein
MKPEERDLAERTRKFARREPLLQETNELISIPVTISKIAKAR